MSTKYIDEAAGLWHRGEALEAGRVIVDHLPQDRRPKWASRLLCLVIDKTHVQSPAIDQLLQSADRSADWKGAKAIFDVLRDRTLGLEGTLFRTRKRTLELLVYYMAENVAKVTYNASDPEDPFDDDSGWWVVSCLRDITDAIGDDVFTTEVLRRVCVGSP